MSARPDIVTVRSHLDGLARSVPAAERAEFAEHVASATVVDILKTIELRAGVDRAQTVLATVPEGTDAEVLMHLASESGGSTEALLDAMSAHADPADRAGHEA